MRALRITSQPFLYTLVPSRVPTLLLRENSEEGRRLSEFQAHCRPDHTADAYEAGTHRRRCKGLLQLHERNFGRAVAERAAVEVPHPNTSMRTVGRAVPVARTEALERRFVEQRGPVHCHPTISWSPEDIDKRQRVDFDAHGTCRAVGELGNIRPPTAGSSAIREMRCVWRRSSGG